MESGALDGSRARAPGKVRRGGELRAPQSSEQMEKVGCDASEREGGRTSLLGESPQSSHSLRLTRLVMKVKGEMKCAHAPMPCASAARVIACSAAAAVSCEMG